MEQEPPRGEEEQQAACPEQREAVVPRIYVASLADYNAGRLHGAWIAAAQDPDDIWDGISEMLKASPMAAAAEEWAIHDFEGFGPMRLSEWENVGHVSRLAKGIEEHGTAFAHWAGLANADELGQFEDAYLGHWDSLGAYADNLLEDIGLEQQIDRVVPDGLRAYVQIDAEGFGRDLELGGDVQAIDGDGGVYLFRGNW